MRFFTFVAASLFHSGTACTTTTPAPKVKGDPAQEDHWINERRGWFYLENAPMKYIEEQALQERKSEATDAPAIIVGGCFF
jgi:hypothetical protein